MSTERGLETAITLAAKHGWAPIPLVPFTKEPVNKGLFDNPPRTEEHIRAVWEKAQWTINRLPQHESLRGLPPNIGILLGASGVLLLDADTSAEVSAWKQVCDEHSFDPGPPMVRSPGTRGTNGTMKHRDGGHWYFQQPSDLEIPTKIVVPVGPRGSTDHSVLYGGRHLVVIPPSVRDTGPYEYAGGRSRMMPMFLRTEVENYLSRFSRSQSAHGGAEHELFGTSEYEASEQEWEWDERNGWLDVLPAGWTETREEQDGHVVYARPGASSSRSAVAHPRGCSHFPNGKSPAPITFFSSSSGDFLDLLQEGRGRGGVTSATKLRLYALNKFGGDMDAARESLGIPNPRRMSDAEVRALPQRAPLTDAATEAPVNVRGPESATPPQQFSPVPEVTAEVIESTEVPEAPLPVADPDNPFSVLLLPDSTQAPNSAPQLETEAVLPPEPEAQLPVSIKSRSEISRILAEGIPRSSHLEVIPTMILDGQREVSEELRRNLEESVIQKQFSGTEFRLLTETKQEPETEDTAVLPPEPETEDAAVLPPEPETEDAAVLPPEPETEDTAVLPPEPETEDTAVLPPEPETEDTAAPVKKRKAPTRKKKVEEPEEPAEVRIPVTELPPVWSPVPIYEIVEDFLVKNVRVFTPEEEELLTTVENRTALFAHRKVAMGSGTHHVRTVEIAEALSIDPSRTLAVLRGLIPVLHERHGIILRERMVNDDPFQFGCRAAKPEDVAWAIWKSGSDQR